MVPTYITSSGTFDVAAISPAQMGMIVVNKGGTTWTLYNSSTQANYPGHALGMVINSYVPQGNPITVQTCGICPPDFFTVGGGSAGPVCVSSNGGLGRGTSGQVIGTCDASGAVTIFPSYVASGANLAGPVVGEIAGYPLNTTPLSLAKPLWAFDGTQLSPSAPALVTFASDLQGSTSTAQYVQSISGNGGLGGTVTVTANVFAFQQNSSLAAPTYNMGVDAGPSSNLLLGSSTAGNVFVGNATNTMAVKQTVTTGGTYSGLVGGNTIWSLSQTAADFLTLGTAASYVQVVTNGINSVGQPLSINVSGTTVATVSTSGIGGSIVASAPLKFQQANIALTSSTANTLSAAQYSCPIDVFTGTLTGSGTKVVYPAVVAQYVADMSAVSFAGQSIVVQVSGSTAKVLTVSTTNIYRIYVDGNSHVNYLTYS